jgi:clan AA aspartic protease (TIGR02281 family)
MTFWIATTIVMTVPYLILMLMADRFLTVRKGYALLSVVMIAGWVWAAVRMAGVLGAFIPAGLMNSHDLSSGQQVALAVGGIAFLLHLRPIFIGLGDQGDIAMRLLARREEAAYRHPADYETRRAQDVYLRQTVDFRGWQAQEQLAGLNGEPRENGAVRALYAMTWIAIVLSIAAAYHKWDDIAPAGYGTGNHLVAPGGPSNSIVAGSHGPPMHPAAVGTAPAANAHTIAMPPLPTVQRPAEVPGSQRSNNATGGPNEAVAERGGDGHFFFDAVVNGAHLSMLFDTGASVVAIRAEDATALGIAITKLSYSARVKTANGTAEVAPVLLETLTIGNITQRRVQGFVAKQGTLPENLLGQSFLARLAGYNVQNDRLVLKGH